jgi:tetrapyrrole methylase family protein/MazG family protein
MALIAHELQTVLSVVESHSLESLQLLDASLVMKQHYPRFDPGQPALLLGCGRSSLSLSQSTSLPVSQGSGGQSAIPKGKEGSAEPRLGCIQQVLLMAYPPEHPVTVIENGNTKTLALGELASVSSPEGCSILVHALPAASSFEALQDVTSHLRAPDGCPWDRALTWAKLRSSLLEETYELLAALDEDAADKVVEELGDLLLQVAMQTQIAAEAGRFRLPEVIRRIVDKLIRRHPHVFGDTVVSGTDEVLANWEAIKAAERVKNGEQRSPLAGVPSGLPALAQADAYLDRMSRLQATDAPEAPWAPLTDLPPSTELAPDLVGEVLFGMVAWARARGVDAESALRKANARYAAHIAGDELSRANTPG